VEEELFLPLNVERNKRVLQLEVELLEIKVEEEDTAALAEEAVVATEQVVHTEMLLRLEVVVVVVAVAVAHAAHQEQN